MITADIRLRARSAILTTGIKGLSVINLRAYSGCPAINNNQGKLMTTTDDSELVADFSGKYMREQDLSHCNFTNGNFKGADLRGANLSNSVFVGADLEGADLTRCNLTDADFTGANLKNAKLVRSFLIGTNFTDANLSHVDFLSAKFFAYKVDSNRVRYAKVAKLDGADLSFSSFRDTLFGEEITMSNAQLEGADFTEVDLRWVNFEKANLKGVRFNKTNLTDANLEWADATKADFTGAKTEFMQCVATNLTSAIGYTPPADR